MSHLDLSPYVTMVKMLFSEYHFITIVCALLIVAMTLQFYRFLKSVSPALPPILFLFVLLILLLHWTQTRTEPKFLSPAVEVLTRVVPTQGYEPAPATVRPKPAPKAPPKPAN